MGGNLIMKNKKYAIISLLMVLLVIFTSISFTACNKGGENSDEATTLTDIHDGETSEEETDKVNSPEDVSSPDEETEKDEEKENTDSDKKDNASSTNKNDKKTTTKKSDKNTTAKNNKTTTKKSDKPASDIPDTAEEIVALFNKNANKIKTDASKVVKNFEKRIVNEDKTVIPAAIESTAEGMIKSLMGDDTKPTTFATKDEIKENFIVPQQSYVSRLSPDYVVKAECKEKGNTYEIYLKLKDHKNPTAGIGVGAVCDVIETHEIAQKASFIKEFSTTYYNCEIKATMDKSTGRITHIVYSTPLVMNMTVDLFGTHSGSIGFTFVKDYTITY